ncbi:hydantoinase/oxoprolinase family protein [Saccharopolyspora sp. TS4A08]|uniref:Hydantoinase/oxoprolinase family protein n=1 Tax=Saccharopolyspora ipomoeae TaxID=3042027 RepID=A0ABT6PQ43_9PSEU|nr:hydantoinase/oxoprolinase family protein [Saccharopolyspora sp. TS4A08]MDI2029561.1 hydantoinase/oxoprolinase family protein [Saccharopolyspora sp. TS4A08]
MEIVAGIDVGGTFTDVLLHHTGTGELRLAKVFSTPGRQADGLLTGLAQFDVPFADLDAVVHGTTVATNAVLERKGSRTALVTTRGFRDVLELRRRDRPTTYGLTGTYRPLVPRSLSFEVDERIDARGDVLTPLSSDSVAQVAAALRESGAESVAVCLLNSYVNDDHERTLAHELRRLLPGVEVTASYQVCPEPGEFERATTTAVNAFVRAPMSRYLDAVQDQLAEQGFARDVQVMQSNGGLIPARRGGELAVRTLLSGPAAGTVAAAAFGEAAGLQDVISCDMGGTSFDVALIPDGQPAVTAETTIDYGVPIKTPMIDITTIGAGGGSIASVDRAGILQVGPESAGSDPGPACYGRGGNRPTVTDANIVLGRIAAEQQLGTQDGFSLDREAAIEAIRTHVAEPLGLDVTAAALAIVRFANEKMANAIRMVSVDKGHDPREFALVGFGGAGPMHVAELASAVGATTVLVPPHPGALSAYGCLIADVKYDYVTAVGSDVDETTPGDVERVLSDQAELGRKTLEADGYGDQDIAVEHIAEMSFSKQLYSIRVPLGAERDGWTPARLAEEFQREYGAIYHGRNPSGTIRLISLRTVVTVKREPVEQLATATAEHPPNGERTVVFADGPHTAPVLRREALTPGQTLHGPLIVEQRDTTIVLPPATSATVHENGSLIVKVTS